MCKIYPSTAPLTTFVDTATTRIFPFVEVGNVSDCSDHNEYKKMFTTIGRQTTNLKLISSRYLNEDFLVFFPELKHLELPGINHICKFNHIPEKLETISVVTVFNNIEKRALEVLKAIKGLNTIKADWIYLKLEAAASSHYPTLFTVSDELKVILGGCKQLCGPFATNANLWANEPINPSDITGVKCKGSFEDYSVLKSFKNLKELHIKYVLSEEQSSLNPVCCNFHTDLEMPIVEKFVFILRCKLCQTCFKNMVKSFTGILDIELVMVPTNKQFDLIVQTFPNLKHFKTHFGQLQPKLLLKSSSEDDEDEPQTAWFQQLETLEMITNKIDPHFNNYGYDSTCFINDIALKNFPSMPKLKYLALDEVFRKIKKNDMRSEINYPDPNFKYLLGCITRQCPNLTQFSVRSRQYSDDDIYEIASNCRQLKFLRIEITSTWPFTDYQARTIGQLCRKLQVLEIESVHQLRRDDDVVWQFALYELIPTLRIILVIDKDTGFNIGTTRKDFYGRKNLHKQIEFGNGRLMERNMYDRYCDENDDSDSESDDIIAFDSETAESSDDELEPHMVHLFVMGLLGNL